MHYCWVWWFLLLQPFGDILHWLKHYTSCSTALAWLCLLASRSPASTYMLYTTIYARSFKYCWTFLSVSLLTSPAQGHRGLHTKRIVYFRTRAFIFLLLLEVLHKSTQGESALPLLHCSEQDIEKIAEILCAWSFCWQLVLPKAAELFLLACRAEVHDTLFPQGQTAKHKHVSVKCGCKKSKPQRRQAARKLKGRPSAKICYETLT